MSTTDEDRYTDALAMARIRVRRISKQSEVLSAEQIAAEVDKVLKLFRDDGMGDIDKTQRDRLIAELESGFKTFVGKERVIADRGYKPWLLSRKAAIKWDFWRRYREYLCNEGWAEPTVIGLDDFTDTILDHIPDPTREGTWDGRGMVVGHVQSGKTSNYAGLICKAADAGYKVIVVLAGMHKSLRAQTQIRMEEGFLGFKTPSGRDLGGEIERGERVGVGLGSDLKAHRATTRADDGDFKKTAAKNWGVALTSNGPPTLFVIKKNGSVLKNLISWVRGEGDATDADGNMFVTSVPLLVIDDEADQGSIDTKAKERDESGHLLDEDHDPTVLNRRIRELLKLFSRSAYVGYTATPFANVLIHEDNQTGRYGEDLFPRDFIVSLPAPSNYIGPVRVFGLADQPPLPIVRTISDWIDDHDTDHGVGWMPLAHRKEHVPRYKGESKVPPSLREAIRAFVLTISARRARGAKTAHNSMLVHATRFTAVQHAVVEQVRTELSSIRNECSFDGPIWKSLETLWQTDFVPTTQSVSEPGCPPLEWEKVKTEITFAADSITVHEVNGSAGDILPYEAYRDQGRNVIAVGGDKLSRGLTLEGLSVSYFLRASRMYDTLMQMGRWFGYRPEYLDLCRIYTTQELVEWFEHITLANEELRDEFNTMAASFQTPRDYGHRVRSHPAMLVTSQVKMRDGEVVRVSFAGSLSETVAFHRDNSNVEANFLATQRLVTSMGGRPRALEKLPRAGTMGNRRVWSDVDAEHVVTFLESYRAHESARRVVPAQMAKYVAKQNPHGELVRWTVALVGGDRTNLRNDMLCELAGDDFRPAVRSWASEPPEGAVHFPFRIRRPVSPIDEAIDLDSDQFAAALQATLAEWSPDSGRGKSKTPPDFPSGSQIRAHRSTRTGLLLLYTLSPQRRPANKGEAQGVDPTISGAKGPPIIALAVSFPGSKTDETVEYVVNSVWAQQEYGHVDDCEP